MELRLSARRGPNNGRFRLLQPGNELLHRGHVYEQQLQRWELLRRGCKHWANRVRNLLERLSSIAAAPVASTSKSTGLQHIHTVRKHGKYSRVWKLTV